MKHAAHERSYTWHDPFAVLEELAGLSPLEALRRVAAGEAPAAPIADTLVSD